MSITGRYLSDPPVPNSSNEYLDLRIDVNGEVAGIRQVSADTFGVSTGNGGASTYKNSWVIATPHVDSTGTEIVITGPIEFTASSDGSPNETGASAEIRVPPGGGPVSVDVTRASGLSRYTCPRFSNHLRALSVRMAVCNQVGPATLPEYDTSALPAPAGVAARTIRLNTALEAAGIDVSFPDGEPVTIDDGEPRFDAWTDAELNEVLAGLPGGAGSKANSPRWLMTGILASVHEDSYGGKDFTTAGILFDRFDDMQRQGFAVFRQSFTGLHAGPPPTTAAARAMRKYLFTWVHEAGHAFNLEHCDFADSSWMNTRAISDSSLFFGDLFRFEFTADELVHLRHAAFPKIRMGRDPFAGGDDAGLGGYNGLAFPSTEAGDDPPLELLLRASEQYDFLAPVTVEARLRNLRASPRKIDTRLNPEYGRLVVYIQRPDERVLRYTPIACKVGKAVTRTLKPKTAAKGEERYSVGIDLTYGSHGFYFNTPGQYVLRAYYTGAGARPIVSKPLPLRIAEGRPEDADLAQQFFTKDVGTCAYFGGSRAKRLRPALDLLQSIARRRENDVMGADLALTIVKGMCRPFFGLREGNGSSDRPYALEVLEESAPELAVDLTNRALAFYRSQGSERTNISQRRLVFTRARALKAQGNTEQAARELLELYSHFQTRVNPPVLADIQTFARSLLGGNSPF